MERGARRGYAMIAIMLVVAMGCLDPYDPPVSKAEAGFLVVDGFVNTGNKSAQIKLSRALPLDASAKIKYPPVQKANVSLEDANGPVLTLSETSPGTYTISSAALVNGKSFRLVVNLATGQNYQSDYVLMKASPILDEVSWTPDGDYIKVLVDSHDNTGATKYYQWVFTETWEYTSDKYSAYTMKGLVPTPRKPQEDIYVCYNTTTSTKVLISTTTTNTEDIVNDYVLTQIPAGSKKLMRTYSILVQQRALTEEAYQFWSNLQKSTENLGTLFDPLPSEVLSNVRNTKDATEKVLGYFSGGEVQEKRLFIDYDQLPLSFQFVKRETCPMDSVLNASLGPYANNQAAIATWGTPNPIGVIFSSAECTDCRLAGGVLAKPSYWPN